MKRNPHPGAAHSFYHAGFRHDRFASLFLSAHSFYRLTLSIGSLFLSLAFDKVSTRARKHVFGCDDGVRQGTCV